MKISELAERTRISKQTIHHYINAGVLPKPRKLGRNSADYSDRYVDQIRTIKELQNSHFLPLSEIKKILKNQRRSNTQDSGDLRLQNKFFKPLDRLLPAEIVGKMAFRKATGLSLKRLQKLEELEIITPKRQEGKWIYSHEDGVIGQLITEMGHVSADPQNGLDPDGLKQISDIFRDTILKAREQFMKSFSGQLSPEEMEEKGRKMNELMGIYYYHLYRKYSSEAN